jgi:DNA-binding NarL/FixJ family response regulator
MDAKVRIVLSDDHPVVRKGLKLSIEEDESFDVIGEAGDGEEAWRLIQKLDPELALLDVEMPKLSGLEVAGKIREAGLRTRIIFLSFHKDEDILRAALAAGGNGFLLKDSAIQEIPAAIRAVLAGEQYLSTAIALQLLQSKQEPREPLLANLTPAEQRILGLISDGLSSKEIGAQLSIHYRTVENHRTNICRKLNIEGANALLRFAVQNKRIIVG